MMRLFVALQMSEPIKEALISVMQHAKKQGLRGRYVSVQNLHLTMAFLGEVSDPAPVVEALQKVRFQPFQLTLHDTVTFGNILCAGTEQPSELTALAKEIRQRLDEAGIDYDRKKFKPHITLVRNMNGPRPSVTVPAESMMVKSFSLMKSEQIDGKRVYTEVWAK